MPVNELSAKSLYDDFRREVDDLLIEDENDINGTVSDEDNLFTDCEIYEFIDEAQREIASELDLLADTRTLELVDGEDTASYDSRIYDIRRATIPALTRTLDVLNKQELENKLCDDDYGVFIPSSHWEDNVGTPQALITDIDDGKLRPYPIPDDDYTVTLYVYRYPLFDVEGKSSRLEVKGRQYKRSYLSYMKYLAYSKQDVDSFNQTLANEFLAEYEQLHMPKVRKRNRTRTRNKMVTTGYGGY